MASANQPGKTSSGSTKCLFSQSIGRLIRKKHTELESAKAADVKTQPPATMIPPPTPILIKKKKVAFLDDKGKEEEIIEKITVDTVLVVKVQPDMVKPLIEVVPAAKEEIKPVLKPQVEKTEDIAKPEKQDIVQTEPVKVVDILKNSVSDVQKDEDEYTYVEVEVDEDDEYDEDGTTGLEGSNSSNIIEAQSPLPQIVSPLISAVLDEDRSLDDKNKLRMPPPIRSGSSKIVRTLSSLSKIKEEVKKEEIKIVSEVKIDMIKKEEIKTPVTPVLIAKEEIEPVSEIKVSVSSLAKSFEKVSEPSVKTQVQVVTKKPSQETKLQRVGSKPSPTKTLDTIEASIKGHTEEDKANLVDQLVKSTGQPIKRIIIEYGDL